MPVGLVKAAPEDVPLIRSLAERIWRDHYPAIISMDQIEYMLEWMYGAEKLLEQIRSPAFTYWLIIPSDTEDKQQALGIVAVENQGDGRFFIHKFYIDQRGKGVGTDAFRQLLARMPGARTIRLYVNRRNFKSVNFYFKNGFVIREWLDQPFGPNYVMDDFLMEHNVQA